VGRSIFLGVSTPLIQCGGAPATPIWGFLSINAFTLCQRTTKFDVGRGVQLWVMQPRLPTQMSRVPGIPNFWGSPVFMPTPFNTERSNSARYGDGRFQASGWGSASHSAGRAYNAPPDPLVGWDRRLQSCAFGFAVPSLYPWRRL